MGMSRILEYTNGITFEEFKKDYKTVDAVIRNFEIIGEASKNLPSDLKEKFPEVPWEEMYLMRNKDSMNILESIMRSFGTLQKTF